MNPKYLVKKYNPTYSTPVPGVGDRVTFTDGSQSLECFKDGMQNTAPAYSKCRRCGVILAVGCVLPAEESTYNLLNKTNDTVVMTDEETIIFCRLAFLKKL